jgi:hypothetical protein
VTLLLLLACTGGAKNDDSAAAACDVRVEGTVPAADAADAYFRGAVEFKLTDPDPFATVAVEGVPGVTSTRGTRGQVVVFTPDAPLAPLTTYTATLSFCGGEETLSFTTSAAGLPLEEGVTLDGSVFAIPFPSGRIVEPDGAAGVLGEYVTQVDLLQIEAVEGDVLRVTNGLAVEGVDPPAQDWCVPTRGFEGDFAATPTFSFAGDGVELWLAGYLVELRELTVSGTFLPDGRSIAGGEIAYVMDTRPLVALFDSTDPNAVCDAAAQVNETCEPCPDSGEPTCLRFHLDQLEGTVADGLALDYVLSSNCPGCADAPPPEDAVCE